MALPMVHLLVAWAWAQDKPELRENPDYYLGAISPDAVHIRDGNDKSHKNEIHLNNWRTPDADAVLRYWANHQTPFDIGYGIHVLLDGQWAVGFRKRFPEMLRPDGKPDPQIYYNDTLITDFELYHHSKLTRFLMQMVREGHAPSDHALLGAREFTLWQRDTIRFYQRPCPAEGPIRFISRDYVDCFMKECLPLMNLTYERMLKMNETQKSILERRSIRGYTEEKLTESEIQTLMDAALASPTACNYQDWHFSFVTNQELLNEFSADYLRIMRSGLPAEEAQKKSPDDYNVFFHAPLVVFIALPQTPKSRFPQVDAGIAVENLALSAQGMGLGSVILGRPRDVLQGPNGAQWAQRMKFPDGYVFAIAIAIGHPATTKEAHPLGENKITRVE